MSGETTSVVVSLRKLIREGRYAPGKRIAELHVAEHLGVSRTPVRLAFRTLQEEGLLQKAGKRGFMVREFTDDDVQCALEVRGVLEGLAARRLVEMGVPSDVSQRLKNCVEEGGKLLEKGYLTKEDITHWSKINQTFHSIIIESTGSQVIADTIARNNHLPFASADSMVIDTESLDKEYQKLHLAQIHHQMVYQALSHGEGARAEMLMREHAYIGLRYGAAFGLDEASPDASA